MTQHDYRAKMSVAEFDSIVFDERCPIEDYYVELFDGNRRFVGIRQEYPRGYEDIKLIKQLTKAIIERC